MTQKDDLVREAENRGKFPTKAEGGSSKITSLKIRYCVPDGEPNGNSKPLEYHYAAVGNRPLYRDD